MVSFGEKLSCRLMVAMLRDRDIPAEYVDLSDIVPSNNLDQLKPDFFHEAAAVFGKRVEACNGRVPVITGFFGAVPGMVLEEDILICVLSWWRSVYMQRGYRSGKRLMAFSQLIPEKFLMLGASLRSLRQKQLNLHSMDQRSFIILHCLWQSRQSLQLASLSRMCRRRGAKELLLFPLMVMTHLRGRSTT
ncbi:hypothetical protein LB505_009760 [Fusarium chuoi]|nr:hypothetical protein LB505_009760 [Fusarium chuoi]